MTKVVEDDKARQAGPGRPVLYVLVASLVLAGVYLASMMGWSGTSPTENAQPQTQGTSSPPSTATPAPAPSGTTGGAPASR